MSDSNETPGASLLSGRAERFALRVMQLGAIAVVLVATTLTSFELDRFFVPKELVLHLTAVLAGLAALRALGRISYSRIDQLLALYLLLSAISAATATNRWLGLRALAVSASALVLFWTARALRASGLARPLLHAVALATVLAAVTSLLQAYGVRFALATLERAPGGTLGNRNFVGHVAAFGLPVLLLAAVQASRRRGYVLASIGVTLVTAALVLTRSRAAWVACVAVAVIFAGALIASRALRTDGRTWRRLAGIVLMAAIGIGAALLLPNALHWNSENPYLQSMRGLASYDAGSGHGRLVQYGHSLRMAAGHPLFGVGPGNWAVVYPSYAPRRDPSLNPSDPGTTYNPWPSSDWIAFIAERGLVAAVLLAFVLFSIAIAAFRKIVAAVDPDDALLATALLGTVAAAVVAGAFDAVLLLALPALLVWMTLGALMPPAPPVRTHFPRVVAIVMIAISAAGAARSAAQLMAMDLYASGDRSSLQRAARIDPASYRAQLRLAQRGSRKERCSHAQAARALFPNADAARSLMSGCQ